jgi:hypothetical protein
MDELVLVTTEKCRLKRCLYPSPKVEPHSRIVIGLGDVRAVITQHKECMSRCCAGRRFSFCKATCAFQSILGDSAILVENRRHNVALRVIIQALWSSFVLYGMFSRCCGTWRYRFSLGGFEALQMGDSEEYPVRLGSFMLPDMRWPSSPASGTKGIGCLRVIRPLNVSTANVNRVAPYTISVWKAYGNIKHTFHEQAIADAII